jgi:hypothetical protein
LSGRYAVTADGQHFLLSTPVEEDATAPITVVLNWTAEPGKMREEPKASGREHPSIWDYRGKKSYQL